MGGFETMGYCRAVGGPVVETRENAPTRGRLSLRHTRETAGSDGVSRAR